MVIFCYESSGTLQAAVDFAATCRSECTKAALKTSTYFRLPHRLGDIMGNTREFERAGYMVVDGIISGQECERLIAFLPPILTSGSRTLLALEPFQL